MSLSEQQLVEIEARANAATPGEWYVADSGIIIQTNHITRDVWFIPKTPEDNNFIASARTDVPALLADLKEARRLLEDCVDELHDTTCDAESCRCNRFEAFLRGGDR